MSPVSWSDTILNSDTSEQSFTLCHIQECMDDVISSLDSQIQLIASSANQQMSVTSEISTNIEAIHQNSESVTGSLGIARQKAESASSGSQELNQAVSSFNI